MSRNVTQSLGLKLKFKLSKSAVYSLHYSDCPAVYVGQSGHKISTRIHEHLKQFDKYKDSGNSVTNSVFANHLLSTQHHRLTPENVKILHDCDKGKKLDLLEKLEITRAKNSPGLTCVTMFSTLSQT